MTDLSLGILGGGQLGRMLAQAAERLGVKCRFVDHSPLACAREFGELIAGEYTDQEILEQFVKGLDAATFEFENVPLESALWIAQRVKLFPGPEALRVSQDRMNEKSFFQDIGVPVPKFLAVDTREDLARAIARVGLPAVLKTRRFGYDGKGQYIIESDADSDAAFEKLGGRPLILEEKIAFDREVSMIGVRGLSGETAFYPLNENHHRGGILRLSLSPAPNLSSDLQRTAEEYARRAMTALNYVGVFTIEFFERDGMLIANEMAPRVHNSGHWTIEGAATSQFENHVRAVCGMPLGDTQPRGCSVMINIIGEPPTAGCLAGLPGAKVHMYGKEPKPGRKLGHITISGLENHKQFEPAALLRVIDGWAGRTMKVALGKLLEDRWGLIIGFPSPIFFSNCMSEDDADGKYMQGVYISFTKLVDNDPSRPVKLIDNGTTKLLEWFAGRAWGLSNQDADVIDGILATAGVEAFMKVDRQKLLESCAGWIHVVVDGRNAIPPLQYIEAFGPYPRPGVMIWNPDLIRG